MRDERRREIHERAQRSVEELRALGWSEARISMHTAKEAAQTFFATLSLAWSNGRLTLRCFFLACLMAAGGCSEALPAECQFYQAEIEKAEHCIGIGGCARSAEQEREYIGYMEAELGYCKRRAKMAEGNALKRGP